MSELSKEVQQIQTQAEIDDMLMSISAIDRQIEHYETLKKHRVAPIDAEVDRLEAKKEEMRATITDFMTVHNEKSLKYPGLATVSRSAGTAKWVVVDEDKLLKFIYDTLKDKPAVLDTVVKVEPKLVKKELEKVLNTLSSVPEEVAIKPLPKPSLRITFEKTDALLEKTKEKQVAMIIAENPSNPPEPATVIDNKFDALDFT